MPILCGCTTPEEDFRLRSISLSQPVIFEKSYPTAPPQRRSALLPSSSSPFSDSFTCIIRSQRRLSPTSSGRAAVDVVRQSGRLYYSFPKRSWRLDIFGSTRIFFVLDSPDQIDLREPDDGSGRRGFEYYLLRPELSRDASRCICLRRPIRRRVWRPRSPPSAWMVSSSMEKDDYASLHLRRYENVHSGDIYSAHSWSSGLSFAENAVVQGTLSRIDFFFHYRRHVTVEIARDPSHQLLKISFEWIENGDSATRVRHRNLDSDPFENLIPFVKHDTQSQRAGRDESVFLDLLDPCLEGWESHLGESRSLVRDEWDMELFESVSLALDIMFGDVRDPLYLSEARKFIF